METPHYDVAFSFASEDEKQILAVERELERGIKVYLYKKEQALTWGQSLRTVLRDIFQKRSKLCVMFISEHSAKKPWTIYERWLLRPRLLRRLWRGPAVLPVRLDDAKVPDIDPEVVFMDLRQTTPQKLATYIERQLDILPPPRRTSLALACVALLATLLIVAVFFANACFLHRIIEQPALTTTPLDPNLHLRR